MYEPDGHKEMTSAHTLSDLGSASFLIDPPDRNLGLADILIEAMQIPDPENL